MIALKYLEYCTTPPSIIHTHQCKYLYGNRDNAAVNGYLELTLLKGRQRLDAISTSNLEVYKFLEFNESSPNLFLNMMNLYLVKFEAR